ncbi:MAG: 6,7-dimethyl-8-ribityllumazine synthase [Saprospiraceae bacterium]|nr:6,7-dimethyl-8-ribityllumazine synthase [Saprospiraceae bacterium]MCB0603910.1 6,7-dimethyl-8-ribityllumazine synthase [Saprospiraceae bacterium]
MAEHTALEIPDISDIAENLKIGIVSTEWNPDIIHTMLTSAELTLINSGLRADQLNHIVVPGAFELPLGAKLLLESGKHDAIICLGCVIKGETSHDQHINRAVSGGLMQLGIMSDIPVIFGVLTPNNIEQAKERSNGVKEDKGKEAAITALKMILLKHKLSKQKKKIGYA